LSAAIPIGAALMGIVATLLDPSYRRHRHRPADAG
jgi:hypothetical protein